MVQKGRHKNFTQCHLHLFRQKDGQQSILEGLSALLPGVKIETAALNYCTLELEVPFQIISLYMR